MRQRKDKPETVCSIREKEEKIDRAIENSRDLLRRKLLNRGEMRGTDWVTGEVGELVYILEGGQWL